MANGYSASAEFDTADELYDFLKELDVGSFDARGTAAPVWEIDLEEVHERLKSYPGTNYRISLTYGDEPTAKAAALVGPMPQLVAESELNDFDSFDQFREFLENEERYWS